MLCELPVDESDGLDYIRVQIKVNTIQDLEKKMMPGHDVYNCTSPRFECYVFSCRRLHEIWVYLQNSPGFFSRNALLCSQFPIFSSTWSESLLKFIHIPFSCAWMCLCCRFGATSSLDSSSSSGLHYMICVPAIVVLEIFLQTDVDKHFA